MKITIKTLKGEMIQTEVEATTTILQIKQKLKELKGFEVQSQKIVLKGKATQNEDTVEKLNIKDKDFLVVMATVKKPQAKKQQVKVQQKKQQKPATKPQVKNQTKPQKKASQKQQNQAEDPVFENKVTQLMGMGFPRQKCAQALRAAFGDSERAVQYLLNGIPAGLTGQQGQGAPTGNPLAGMIGGSDFNQLRALLQSNPTAIQSILEQLAQTSPQLYNLISQHPEQFERMIMQGGDEEGEEYEVDDSMEPEGEGEGEQVVVTEAQQQAIERLAALGFSKVEAAQAYLACDKNEEMAANLLFDRLANGDIEQGAFEEDFEDEDNDNLFN